MKGTLTQVPNFMDLILLKKVYRLRSMISVVRIKWTTLKAQSLVKYILLLELQKGFTESLSWDKYDVDPSLFLHNLMTNGYNFVGDEEVNNDPQILMRKAHAATFSTSTPTV